MSGNLVEVSIYLRKTRQDIGKEVILLLFIAVMGAADVHEAVGFDIPAAGLIVVLFVLLYTFEYNTRISPFAARKLTHLSMGTLILLIMLPEARRESFVLQFFVVSVAVGTIILSFVRPLRFGTYADKGIIIFNLLVLIFLLFRLDFGFLAPAFVADPMGAIVGRWICSPKWIGDKTVAGSLAVFVACLLSAFRIEGFVARFSLAAGCAVLEAIGGDFDNFVMNIPIFAYYAASSIAKANGLSMSG